MALKISKVQGSGLVVVGLLLVCCAKVAKRRLWAKKEFRVSDRHMNRGEEESSTLRKDIENIALFLSEALALKYINYLPSMPLLLLEPLFFTVQLDPWREGPMDETTLRS